MSFEEGRRRLIEPVSTTEAHWHGVAETLGRTGQLVDNQKYQVAFRRGDLNVISYGVTVKPELTVGSYATFIRYADQHTTMMGDLAVTENELQQVIDTLQARGIGQTAIHKHLLRQEPAVWWVHVHGIGRDSQALADGLRAALSVTGTPPAAPLPSPALDLDTAGIDAAFGTKGIQEGAIYKIIFARQETITADGRVLPRMTGATSALGFQPLGNGQAAASGDIVMVAEEVQNVLTALRDGGIKIASLHNHGLMEEPRLFYTHFWAVDNAVKVARALHAAVSVTKTKPMPPRPHLASSG